MTFMPRLAGYLTPGRIHSRGINILSESAPPENISQVQGIMESVFQYLGRQGTSLLINCVERGGMFVYMEGNS